MYLILKDCLPKKKLDKIVAFVTSDLAMFIVAGIGLASTIFLGIMTRVFDSTLVNIMFYIVALAVLGVMLFILDIEISSYGDYHEQDKLLNEQDYEWLDNPELHNTAEFIKKYRQHLEEASLMNKSVDLSNLQKPYKSIDSMYRQIKHEKREITYNFGKLSNQDIQDVLANYANNDNYKSALAFVKHVAFDKDYIADLEENYHNVLLFSVTSSQNAAQVTENYQELMQCLQIILHVLQKLHEQLEKLVKKEYNEKQRQALLNGDTKHMDFDTKLKFYQSKKHE